MYSIDHSNGLLSSSHPDWVTMDIEKLGKSFYNSDEQPLSEPIRNLKAKTLDEALQRHNMEVLVSYSKSTEGLINNELRKKIWPILLGIENDNTSDIQPNSLLGDEPRSQISSYSLNTPQSSSLSTSVDSSVEFPDPTPAGKIAPKKSSSKLTKNIKSTSFFLHDLNSLDLPPHKDEEQVKLDIQRSITILSHLQSQIGTTEEEESEHEEVNVDGEGEDCNSHTYTILSNAKTNIDSLKKKLQNLIIKILRKYPSLNYYQGYHDIASIILIICYDNETQTINESLAFHLLEKFTLFHLRDFMIVDINLSVNHLRLIPKLLEEVEPELFELVRQTNSTFLLTNGEYFDYKFYQGLSSILTVFSHDLINLKQILTIWDFMFSYNSVIVNVYIYVSALIYFKDDIFKKLGLSLDNEIIDFANVDKDIVHNSLSPSSLFKNIGDGDLIKILNKAESLIETYPLELFNNAPEPVETSTESLENTASLEDHKSTSDAKPQDSCDWFEYNKHSVLVSTSSPCFSLDDRAEKDSKYSKLFDNTTLSEWIQIQDEEVAKQSRVEFELQQEILDKQERADETSASDFHSSGTISLSSSLSSITSTTSSTALNALSSSSFIFKKIIGIREESSNDGDTHLNEHKKYISKLPPTYFRNIYKISLTIGFIGIVLHYIIRNNAKLSELNLMKYITPPYEEISSISTGLLREFSDGFTKIYHFVERETHGNISQVGLGNIKATIFGFNG